MKATKNLFVAGAALTVGAVGGSAQDSSPLFQVGSVDVRPHAAYSMVYDDNIFLEHKHLSQNQRGRAGRDHDWINTLTPGLKLSAGDVSARESAYFSANYEAIFQKFIINNGADAIDQNALIEFGGNLNNLKLTLSQGFTRASQADNALFAANGRVRRANYTTKVGGAYEVSEKTTVGIDLYQDVADYAAPLVDSTDRSANLYMDYQVLPKVKLGLSGGVGYYQIEGNATSHNPNSVLYNGRARLNWQATEKVTIGGSVGIQAMNIQEATARDRVGFAFDLDANWKAGERTNVGLRGSRGRKLANAFGAQLNEETTVALQVRQGLADAISLDLDGGYTLSHYEAATSNLAVAGSIRDDNYMFLKPAVSYRFMERAQAKVFYQYRRNDANLAFNGNDFYNTQVGLELSYRF